MTWSIDSPQARLVCSATDEQAAQLDTVTTTVANAFEGAHGAVALAPETSAALAEVAADPFLIRLAAIRRLISTVTETTEQVIELYDAADFEMAAESQETLRGLEP